MLARPQIAVTAVRINQVYAGVVRRRPWEPRMGIENPAERPAPCYHLQPAMATLEDCRTPHSPQLVIVSNIVIRRPVPGVEVERIQVSVVVLRALIGSPAQSILKVDRERVRESMLDLVEQSIVMSRPVVGKPGEGVHLGIPVRIVDPAERDLVAVVAALTALIPDRCHQTVPQIVSSEEHTS